MGDILFMRMYSFVSGCEILCDTVTKLQPASDSLGLLFNWD